MNKSCKTCTTCKNTFPATTEYFNRDKQKLDGFRPECKKCRSAQRTEDYKNSPSLMQRAREKAAEWFRNNKERAHRNRTEYYRQHRDEAIQDSAEWRKKNPDKYKAANREQWQRSKGNLEKKESHAARTRNRRAKLRSVEGKHTAADIREIFERQNGCCFYCKEKLRSFEVDHYYPISKGGSNSKENLVVACKPCNGSKGNKLPQDFMGR